MQRVILHLFIFYVLFDERRIFVGMNDLTKKSLYDICVNHKDVLLVDLMNNLHRFNWAYRDLYVVIDNEVVPTGYLYGFLNFLISLKSKFPHCAIVLALDGRDEERVKINPEYKANRVHEVNLYESVQEIVCFCSMIKDVFTVYSPKYEADDAIYSVALTLHDLCKKKEIRKSIYILSNDKDFFQVIRDDEYAPIQEIRKFGSGKSWREKSDIVTEAVVRETFNGVGPHDIVKFRSIVGDSSDNLKGYFRFLKANAAIIALNFDYDEDTQELKLKDGVSADSKWDKFLKVVQGDMSVFVKNYAIMHMKQFDFEIEPASYTLSEEYVRPIVLRAMLYELKSYLREISKAANCRHSRQVLQLLEEFQFC